MANKDGPGMGSISQIGSVLLEHEIVRQAFVDRDKAIADLCFAEKYIHDVADSNDHDGWCNSVTGEQCDCRRAVWRQTLLDEYERLKQERNGEQCKT